MFYVAREDHVQPYGVTPDQMRELVETILKENEKKERKAKAEEQQYEKQRANERREDERKRLAQEREQERADKEAERKRKEREKEFEAIAKLPRLAHGQRLTELAKRLGEDLESLCADFAPIAGRKWRNPSSRGKSRSKLRHF